MLKTNEQYMKNLPNEFILALIASMRIKELKKGARALVQTKEKREIEIAFEEIRQGKIGLKIEEDAPRII